MSARRIPCYYKSTEIKGLPMKIQDNNDILWVDYLKSDEISKAYAIAKEAAASGLNIGTNEYRNLKEFNFMLSDAEAFTFKDDSGKIQGVVAMHPCWLSRSCSSCLVTLVVIPSMHLYKTHSYRILVNIGCKLIIELDLHYELCVMNVFVACSDIVLELRKEGFRPQLLIQDAGTLMGYGLQDNYIMVKDLKVAPKLHRSLEEVCAMIEQYKEEKSVDDIVKELPKIPFLPKPLNIKNGLQVKVRNAATEEDIRVFYNLFKLTMKLGEGYGIDEFPSFTFFSQVFLDGQYVAIFEDIKTGKCFGGVAIQPHWAQRTREGKSADTALIIHPDFQGNKTGTHMLYICLIMLKKLGFTANMSDVLLTNIRMIKLVKKMNYQAIGIFPKSTFLKNHGWMDSILTYLELINIPDDFDEFHVKSNI